jgi:diguanylate cyclase (GGDEF)-like protein
MNSPSRQPTGRFSSRRLGSHDLTRGGLVFALAVFLACVAGAFLFLGFHRSSAALADAKERRATVESLERESTRIEITGWRVWRTDGEFMLTPSTALQALALVDQTRAFYVDRVADAPRSEAALAQHALELLDAVPDLVGAGGSESVPPDLADALERFPEFIEEQQTIHLAWLEVNRQQIVAHERRRERWAWTGLTVSAALLLALGSWAGWLVRRNARLRRETIARLRRQVATDALTGLINQGEFHERLARAVERAHRTGEPLSVIVLDVDHFKRVNDAHGHQMGDRVLAEIARRILIAARSEDCVGRVGGEEFAWILPRVAESEAVEAARRARLAVSAEPVIGIGELTVSAGVAELEAGVDAVTLYRQADLALYRAKDLGRDRVVRHSFGEDATRGPRILSPR